MKPQVIVIGAGIGGLTAALALRRAGFPVTVYEQAPVLGEVGAGVGLWCNATRLLERLGVGEQVRRLALPIRQAEMANPRGKVLQHMNIGQLMGRATGENYIVHRADLHRVLREALPAEVLVTGAPCTAVREVAGGVEADVGGRTVRGDLLIGADGIHSVVRAALVGDGEPRYAGETCYRGVAEIAYPDWNVLREIQGDGRRVGICPLGQKRIYWWATEPRPRGSIVPPAGRKAHLKRLFADWLFGLTGLIEASENILQNDLLDRLPVARWGRGRMTLLGDAAHPTTPNLGMGACMAIEDAVVLARNLVKSDSIEAALADYERERIGRTSRIVQLSYRFGKVGQWRSPVAVWLRERLVAWAPSSFQTSLFTDQFEYDPGWPEPAPASGAQAAAS